jgi:hypothetical protein
MHAPGISADVVTGSRETLVETGSAEALTECPERQPILGWLCCFGQVEMTAGLSPIPLLVLLLLEQIYDLPSLGRLGNDVE